MKKLILVLLLMGCSATYRITDGRTQVEFDNTVKECQSISGTKIAGLAFGNPVFVIGALTGGLVYNGVVEYKFRDCMKERGYEVAE